MFVSVQPTVSEHLPVVTELLYREGITEPSRNGYVRVLDRPFCVTTRNPKIRTLLCPLRKNNPFVDFFDGLFILAGTQEYKYLVGLHDRLEKYTEYNGKAHGQYSHRILGLYFNQLFYAAEHLFRDNDSRRAVIQLWDPLLDHHASLQDVPCNLCCLPRIRFQCLDLTVFNRSNDVYWGMLGVNIVQFSILQECLAYLIGVPTGTLHQVSNNAHAYMEFGPYDSLKEKRIVTEPWHPDGVPLFEWDKKSFDDRIRNCNEWMRILNRCWKTANFTSCKDSPYRFHREVVFPMSVAAQSRGYDTNHVGDPNWRKALEIYNVHRSTS